MELCVMEGWVVGFRRSRVHISDSPITNSGITGHNFGETIGKSGINSG